MLLARAFLANAAPAESGPDLAALDAELGAMLAEARRAWPDLPLSDEEFCARLALHWGSRGLEAFPRAHVGDFFLASACASGVAGAAATFERRFGPIIDAALGRMRLGPGLDTEVKQRLRTRLLVDAPELPARIASYSGQGQLAAWVRAVATRLALNLVRDEGRHGSDEELYERLPSAHDDPELRLLKARYAAPFREAFKEAVASLDARSRLILKQHYIDGLSTEELGGRYGVHRVTVLRWLVDARARIAQDTEQRLGATLGMPSHELESIARLVRSQLDLSLHDMMGVG